MVQLLASLHKDLGEIDLAMARVEEAATLAEARYGGQITVERPPGFDRLSLEKARGTLDEYNQEIQKLLAENPKDTTALLDLMYLAVERDDGEEYHRGVERLYALDAKAQLACCSSPRCS